MPQSPLAAVVATDPSANLVTLKVDASGNLQVALPELEPSGATPVNVSSGNVANASAVAAMPAVAAKTNFCSGITLTASGATAGLPVVATLAGVIGGPLHFIFTFPAGVLVGAAQLSRTFDPPLQASAINTAITLTLPAGGAGNTNAAAVITGVVE